MTRRFQSRVRTNSDSNASVRKVQVYRSERKSDFHCAPMYPKYLWHKLRNGRSGDVLASAERV